MAGDEYSIGGGKLKLKGSKVSNGRVEKKKKKSKKEPTQPKAESAQKAEENEGVRSENEEHDAPAKTEAEKRAEEIRRKRVWILFCLFVLWAVVRTTTDDSGQLHERLQREGVKTHKERVEELNKYLSRLSEHHDMYVLCLLIFLRAWKNR